jgi:hypothetical protein
MILQQSFCLWAGRKSATLLGVVVIVFAQIASAAPLDTAEALNLITQTADRICSVVSTKGEAESADVKGQVQAQLTGLAAKLASVGVSGTGSINNEQYQNVLRQDLASTLHDNAQCKLKVFQTLEGKLLPESHQTNPQSAVQRDPIAWLDETVTFVNGSAPDLLHGFALDGTNTSPTPVQLTNAYVMSEITGEQKALEVEVGPSGALAPISEINDIPPNAHLRLWANFGSSGISVTDFLGHWGSFLFHAEYAGFKHEKVFSRDTVEKYARMAFPELGPHITRRQPSPH